MEDKINLKIGLCLDDGSSESFKEEIRKIVKDVIREEMIDVIKNISKDTFGSLINGAKKVSNYGGK